MVAEVVARYVQDRVGTGNAPRLVPRVVWYEFTHPQTFAAPNTSHTEAEGANDDLVSMTGAAV